MPTPSETVSLRVEGMEHQVWSDYEVDSDLLVPADAFNFTVSQPELKIPPAITPGARAEVFVGTDLVMTGRIDVLDHKVGKKQGRAVHISGRDQAAALVDCSCNIFTGKQVSLDEIIAKTVVPLGIPANKIRVFAAATRRREKISINPEQRAWEVLSLAAEANGLWPWFEPDGTLVVGGPDYSQPPVATLILRGSGEGNNCESMHMQRSIAGRYSEVTVLGQRPGHDFEDGKNALKATEKDTSVSWYRPLIVTDHEAESVAVCRSRARKLLADSRLKAMTLLVTVYGHRIVAPGDAADGKLWTPGQRIRVISDQYGDAIYFLMARKFLGGRDRHPITNLVLKEDGAWLLDAHPHKKKHRRHKGAATLEILDLTKGAPQ